MAAVELERDGSIALILVDNPPVNAISQAVRQGIADCVASLDSDDSLEAAVLSARGRTFMAGADIGEFGKPPQPPVLPEVVDTLEAASKPIVAAIHGTALGGGLELALGCHYRVADAKARLGQPEVNLGLIPGAEGTQRLPRLIGLKAALEMIVTGKPVDARTALDTGLLDEIVEGELLEGAIGYVRQLVEGGAPLRRVSNLDVADGVESTEVFEEITRLAKTRMRGQTAPLRAIESVKAALELPFAEGVRRERELFLEGMNDPQSAAMRHAFFAEREAARVPGLSKETPLREIAAVGIVGGGTMGGGIALACAAGGLSVMIVEQNEDAAEAARKRIADTLEGGVKKGKLSETAREAQQSRITVTTEFDALGKADLVIEAVFEDLDVKREVFARLDKTAKDGAILATNTSYQDVNAIAEATGRPGDVLGLHFFSPANIMKLLEVVRAGRTADDALATALKFAKRIGKVPVVAGVCYGFIGNRMLQGYQREAGLLLLEGATPEQIDGAIHDFGFPMGPLQMADLAGIDVGYLARQKADPDSLDPFAFRVHDRLVEAGRKGQKTGAGFYRYEGRKGEPDPDVAAIIDEAAAKAGFARRDIADEEIVERCMLPLINEGARILEEGVAIRAGDIDVVYLYGYGFPRWRGGPMFYADTLGLDHVCDRIAHYRDIHGERWWTTAPLIERLGGEGGSFAALDSDRASD